MKYTILIFSILLTACFGKKPDITGLEGKPMPSFDLLLSDSSTLFNTKNIPEGKPSVLFLFGPHCPYSHAQMKEIVENIKELQDIKIYALTPWPFTEMKMFYKTYHIEKYKNITMGYDTANFFGNYYKVPGVPYIALYDKDKKLSRAFSGSIDTKLIHAISEKVSR